MNLLSGAAGMKSFNALFLAVAMIATPVAVAEPQTPSAAAAPTIVIYHAEGRRSERVAWLCEELGLPYELKYRRGDVAGSFADIRAINPGMAVAPTVIYNGQILNESGAILELILDRHGGGKLRPAVNSPDYPAYLMFMHFAEGSPTTARRGRQPARRRVDRKRTVSARCVTRTTFWRSIPGSAEANSPRRTS